MIPVRHASFPISFLAGAALCLLFASSIAAQTGDVPSPSPTADPNAPAISGGDDGEGLPGVVFGTANVRSGPDTRFPIVDQLSQGAAVIVTARDGEPPRWVQVTLPSGAQGWLPTFVITFEANTNLSALPLAGAFDPLDVTPPLPVVSGGGTPLIETLEPGGDAPVSIVAYGRVNVRLEPSIDGEIVGQLDVNDAANATARCCQTNDWLFIETDSLEGWVAYFTVQVTGDVEALPVLVPDSSNEALIPPSLLIATRFNARLHTAPELASPIVVIVRFGEVVTPIARSEDGEWIYVGWQNFNGWGAADLFDSEPGELDTLPIFLAPTPTRSPLVIPTRTPNG